METKWDPKEEDILSFHQKLQGLEETFLDKVPDSYLYYQLWKQIPEEYCDRLISANKPKTRDEIVSMVQELHPVSVNFDT